MSAICKYLNDNWIILDSNSAAKQKHCEREKSWQQISYLLSFLPWFLLVLRPFSCLNKHMSFLVAKVGVVEGLRLFAFRVWRISDSNQYILPSALSGHDLRTIPCCCFINESKEASKAEIRFWSRFDKIFLCLASFSLICIKVSLQFPSFHFKWKCHWFFIISRKTVLLWLTIFFKLGAKRINKPVARLLSFLLQTVKVLLDAR